MTIGPDDRHPKQKTPHDRLEELNADLKVQIAADGAPEPLIQAVSERDKYPFVAPTPDELQARIDAAIVTAPVDPAATVTYGTEDVKIEDLPSADLRASLGYGHYGPFSRPVIERTDGKQWPYTPNMCLLAANYRGVWVDPEHLACPGCGLDIT